jgi:hypothetical protein
MFLACTADQIAEATGWSRLPVDSLIWPSAIYAAIAACIFWCLQSSI